MAKLEILTFPNARLRNHAEPVAQVDANIQRIVDDMLETMYAAPGIGLAAIQVGIAKRIVVIDISENHNQPVVLINPEILALEGEEEMDEGCLSVPGYYETVRRAERVRARALNRKGKSFELETGGLLAVCIQHEIDHLEGKLFVDYLSSLKRQRIRRKLEKDQRAPRQAPPRRAAARQQAAI
ncbi:peptide deformylase [Thiorhodovibrio frisius]|uniref:Peptide deformylase n=1 Tax=Thiorhodovibrio frisius TaxID=631362 RepID=H8YX83_9GAMM|nr:peptide deformylase [Thiorhodovibrio frisius]EIC23059.1 peptide deformylase [Thiorhodovibrio frisius]WPL22676.1 Peptide deformylase [Thiorhodovibrio frisius]